MRNPVDELRVHRRWADETRKLGVKLASIGARAAYVVNTSENNSETVGPHADWRAGVVREVNRLGRPMVAEDGARWELRLAEIRSANLAEAA